MAKSRHRNHRSKNPANRFTLFLGKSIIFCQLAFVGVCSSFPLILHCFVCSVLLFAFSLSACPCQLLFDCFCFCTLLLQSVLYPCLFCLLHFAFAFVSAWLPHFPIGQSFDRPRLQSCQLGNKIPTTEGHTGGHRVATAPRSKV